MNEPLPEKFEQAANNLASLLDIAPSAQEIIRVQLCKFAIHLAEQLFPEYTYEEARAKALSIKDMERASWMERTPRNKEA